MSTLAQQRHARLPARGPGRPKGSPNKMTSLLKDAIVRAAELEGGEEGLVGYLRVQAIENPGPFMGLLGKVLPLQVSGETGGPIVMRWLRDDEPAPDA